MNKNHKLELIINADDLGFSKGINYAVLKANNEGFLTHSSLMANMSYFNHAIKEIIPKTKNLNIGVHLNLTCGKSLSNSKKLSNKGIFKNSFITLLFKPKTAKVLYEIEQELELQILKIKEKGIKITHIDGHEHIHIIPSINKIVKKLAHKYNIPRIREINENFKQSYNANRKTISFVNYIKYMLLKFLSFFNDNTREVGFYSILNTCEINADNLFCFLETQNKYTKIEIMLHPSIIGIDNTDDELAIRFDKFLKSPYRTQEYELCFNPKFKKYLK